VVTGVGTALELWKVLARERAPSMKINARIAVSVGVEGFQDEQQRAALANFMNRVAAPIRDV
jgi:hypothetical protein